jgi:hypothetical protein
MSSAFKACVAGNAKGCAGYDAASELVNTELARAVNDAETLCPEHKPKFESFKGQFMRHVALLDGMHSTCAKQVSNGSNKPSCAHADRFQGQVESGLKSLKKLREHIRPVPKPVEVDKKPTPWTLTPMVDPINSTPKPIPTTNPVPTTEAKPITEPEKPRVVKRPGLNLKMQAVCKKWIACLKKSGSFESTREDIVALGGHQAPALGSRETVLLQRNPRKHCLIKPCRPVCKTSTKSKTNDGRATIPYKVTVCGPDRACRAANLHCAASIKAQQRKTTAKLSEFLKPFSKPAGEPAESKQSRPKFKRGGWTLAPKALVSLRGWSSRSPTKYRGWSSRSPTKPTRLTHTPRASNAIACYNPFIVDPEASDCSSRACVAKKCKGSNFATCYRSMLCRNPRVCSSWKDKVCAGATRGDDFTDVDIAHEWASITFPPVSPTDANTDDNECAF